MIMRKIAFVCALLFVCGAVVVNGQPKKRRTTTTNEVMKQGAERAAAVAAKGADRMSIMFPTRDAMPEDVVWRRDIYRVLDLGVDANATLYYPVEPMGRQVNLFTYVFRLMLTGRINAYTYKLDGVESFDGKDRMEVRDVLDRYSIYYEEKDGRFTVENNDIPSAEVTRYYLKECVYVDQRTGCVQRRVTALCPVLMRGADDFGGEATPYPLFWLNYDEIAPWLAKLPVMSSNLNTVSNMTADDYFTMNRYDGKVYKTNNLQGRALAHYCKSDSAMSAEQAKIEKQIRDFDTRLWGGLTHEDSLRVMREDSVAKAKAAAAASAKKKRSGSSLFGRSARSAGSVSGTDAAKAADAGKADAGEAEPTRVSVRRQRR